MKTIWTFLVALAVVAPALGMSIIFPTYSRPVLADNILIVLSADRMHLIGVSKAGKEQWKRPIPSKGSLITHKSGKILLAQQGSVSLLNPKDGTLELLFDSAPKVSWLGYSSDANLFWGPVDGKKPILALFGKKPTLALFDGTTYACIASEKRAERVAYADAELVVLVKGRRKKEKDGYTFSRVWLEAFRRKTMAKAWSVRFENRSSPYYSYAVRCGEYLVCDDGSDLLVINAKSGDVRRSLAAKHEDALRPSGLRNDNGALTYNTSKDNRGDFNQSEHTIYKLSIPDLKVLEKRVVKLVEVARTEEVGELLITDSLYLTACFRRDGTKLWEHFQMHRTSAVDGVIYFSDYNKGVARMGALDVATGEQRIFISERVE